MTHDCTTKTALATLVMAFPTMAAAEVCISTSEGLNPALRVLLLVFIGLAALLLLKGKEIRAAVTSSRGGEKLFARAQAVVYVFGVIALLHNVVLMQFFVINPNLHPEGSYCATHNPGPCFSLLGDEYCLKRPSTSISISSEGQG